MCFVLNKNRGLKTFHGKFNIFKCSSQYVFDPQMSLNSILAYLFNIQLNWNVYVLY